MRIGIITFHCVTNYGAVLQAIALRKKCEELGHEVKIIDYRPRFKTDQYNPFRLLIKRKHWILYFYETAVIPFKYKKNKAFEGFLKTHMKTTEKAYFSNEEIHQAPPKMDIYITGSDQVWNPELTGGKVDDAYYLGFAPQGTKRVAYAASFGTSEIKDIFKEDIKANLLKMDRIAVREADGKELVEQLIGKGKAAHVVDPVLLMEQEEWKAYAEPTDKPKEPYLLIYSLGKNERLHQVAAKTAKELGLKVVNIAKPLTRWDRYDQNVYCASPGQFLDLFLHADAVCTNSYHGTAFSIVLGKPFFVVPNSKRNGRMESLLAMVGLESHMVKDTSAIKSPKEQIHYNREVAMAKLEKARKESLAYLAVACQTPIIDTEDAKESVNIEKLLEASTGHAFVGGLSREEEVMTLRQQMVIKMSQCVGCSACEKICPQGAIGLTHNGEGFLEPIVDETTCTDCGLCITHCPIQESAYRHENREPKAYGAMGDKELRLESASGGVFTKLAEGVLNAGGVVYGAAFDEQFQVIHQAVHDEQDLNALRGSKYVQSHLKESFLEIKAYLKANKPVLFSGTPCQVAGLYAYLGRDDKHLITCDLVCKGVPSPKIFQDYLKACEEKQGAQVVAYRFRDKNISWSKPRIRIQYQNGTQVNTRITRDPYGAGFNQNMTLRPSCHHCAFSKIPRVADITLADFWGVSKHYPDLHDQWGTSLVLINNKKGEALFDKVKKALKTQEVDLKKALEKNHNATSSVKPSPKRSAFFREYQEFGYNHVEKKYMKPLKIHKRLIKVLKKKMKL